MSKLKITPGTWKNDESDVYSDKGIGNIICKSPYIEFTNSRKYWEANAILIADAGTTYNQCGLLSSELLQQNEELKSLLQSILDESTLKCDLPDVQEMCKELLTKYQIK